MEKVRGSRGEEVATNQQLRSEGLEEGKEAGKTLVYSIV